MLSCHNPVPKNEKIDVFHNQAKFQRKLPDKPAH